MLKADYFNFVISFNSFMVLIILLYAICASMFTISKTALNYAQPIFFMAIRMLGAGLLLGGYYFFKSKRAMAQTVRATLADWRLFLQLILFHVYITYICDLCALRQLTSIESALIYNLSPFITALCSYFYFHEVMNAQKWLGLFLGFASLFPELLTEPTHFSHKFIPVLITLIAVISSAYGWVIVRQLVREKSYSPIYVNSVGMFIGGCGALLTSLLTESWHHGPVTAWVPFLKSTLLIIVLANIIFYNLYGYLLRIYTATFLSFAGFLCPLFAALFGYFFLHEQISLNFIYTSFLLILGLGIFYYQELQQGYIEK